MTKTPKRPAAGLPDRDTLIAFLREAGEAEKADIARTFGLKGIERRQLREMLGAEKDRLDWVWLVDDAANIPADLQTAATQAQTLRLPQAQIAAWLKPEPGRALQDHLYLIDPMGNWMMRFPADIEPKKAFRDISRLLRASNSWDRAGRGVVYE